MADGDGILTTEHFMDLLCSKMPSELASLHRLRVKAYPFPLYPSKDATSYITFSFEDLLPLFPGLALQSLEVHDAYHGPDVGEDGWGHNATYDFIGHMIKKGKGWKELVFESQSDRWLEPVYFSCYSADGGRSEKVHGRDPQPQTWDEMIKARDGEDNGAGVEMWHKEVDKGSDWVKVEGQYKSSGDNKTEDMKGSVSNPHSGENGKDGDSETSVVGCEYDDDDDGEKTRPAIRIRIKRGDGADYKQDGHEFLDTTSWGVKQGLYKILENSDWPQIKKDLFIRGAEEDPTAHL